MSRDSQLFSVFLILAFVGNAENIHAAPIPSLLVEKVEIAQSPLATPVAVFGKDNRKFIKGKRSPIAKKIGLLYNRQSRTLCTAFCLDKSIIGTAAHCLFGKAGRRRQKLRYFTFSLDNKSRNASSPIAGAQLNAANQHVITGSTRLRVRPPIDATKDWALIRLQKPVCLDGGLKINPLKVSEIIKASNSQKFYQVAFHRDMRRWQLADSQSCEVNRRFGKYRWATISQDFTQSNRLILHRCDTGGASSGSPLIVRTDDGPTIVGINVGTYIQSRVLMHNGRITKRYKPQTVANTGVSALAFAGLIERLKTARILTSPIDLRNLQNELRMRTLYAGAIDGTYGNLTRTAIQQFEKRKGWPVTGLPTRALLNQFRHETEAITSPAMSETSITH